MLTLTYGYQKPETGDKGAVIWTALETNIQQLNDHTHNNTNSARLDSQSSTAVTQAILSAAWVAGGGGSFSQTVACPGTIKYDTHAIEFRNTANGRTLLLTAEKVSSTTYTLTVNDNTLDVTAVYT